MSSVEQRDIDNFTQMLKDFGVTYEVECHLNIIVVYSITDDGGKDLNVEETGFTFVFRQRDGKFLLAT